MKNKDLIAILSKQDPEAEVYLEYDTMCCVSIDFSIVNVSEWINGETGIYLMCEDEDMVKYIFEKELLDGIKYEIIHGGE